jgi:molybdopterin molybdotransferase
MIGIDEALAFYAQYLPPLAAESIAVQDALMRVLAAPVLADTDLPRFDQSAMDGYAFAAASVQAAHRDRPCRLPVAGQRVAGDAPSTMNLPVGMAARILTGAPLPAGADTVIPQEQVERDDETLLFTAPYPAGRNIRYRGEERHAGSRVAHAGQRIAPGLLAALISAGAQTVLVHRRPRLRILVSGDEVRAPGTPLAPGQIPDSNGPLLGAILARWGLPPPRVAYVGDRLDAVRATLGAALDDADLVISTGGASVGDRDYLPAAAEALGVRRVFWRVAQKPGKPLYFGVRETDAAPRRTAFLALPGNPGAVLVGAALHLRRMLDHLEGVESPQPQWALGVLAAEVERDARRTRLLRMRLRIEQAQVRLEPLPQQDSHMLGNLSAADVLVRVETGTAPVAAGSLLPWLPLP